MRIKVKTKASQYVKEKKTQSNHRCWGKMTPSNWWKHRVANYYTHSQELSFQEQKAWAHLLDVMKLTNTIKAILGEFSRGKSAEGFVLSYNRGSAEHFHPSLGTQHRLETPEALLLGLVGSNRGSVTWSLRGQPPGHRGWTKTLELTTS